MIAPRRPIVAWLAAGLVLRLAFGLIYWVHQPLTHDEREYLALGRSLARGDGFAYPADEPSQGTAQQFGRAPGYPVFLALLRVTERVDVVPARVKVAQALIGTAGIWLIAVIAGRAAGTRAGVFAAALAAIYPPLVFIPAYALTESLYSTVALAAAQMITLSVAAAAREAMSASTFDPPRRGVTLTVLAGALTGTAILIRPTMLFFVPLAALWLILRQPLKSGLLHASIFVGLTLACVMPWTIRNVRVHHRLILVASEGGVTFWTGNHPLARGDGDLAANPTLKTAELEFRNQHSGLTPEELEPLYYRDALRWIRNHPAAWMALLARKLFFTIVPVGASYTLHSTKYLVASAGAYLLLLPAALAGAWLLVKEGHPPIALWLLAVSTVIAGLVFFPQERFRIPVIDPALIVSAAALAAPRAHERTRRRPDL